MKSSFLLTFAFILLTSSASAQISTKPSTFTKFWERVKISYFGALTSPNLRDMKNNEWDNASLSPGFSPSYRDTWPTNIWNQVAFSYNFGAKLAFVIAPRFVTTLAPSTDMKHPEDPSAIFLDDALVGFQGVIYSSDDSKFNLWIRPGVRLPTSHASRNNYTAAGNLTHQLDFTYVPTYDFNKKWQLGMFGQLRQWVFDDQYDFTRFRSITNPYVQYTIDDVSKVQFYYELMLETNRSGKPAGHRDPVFKDKWQNFLLGYGRNITPKLNLFPFVGCFFDKPISDKSFWAGAWISYSIK